MVDRQSINRRGRKTMANEVVTEGVTGAAEAAPVEVLAPASEGPAPVVEASPAPAMVPVAPEAPTGEPAPTAAGLGPEELEALKLSAARANATWERYLRAVADLENYRKRAAREKQEAQRLANEALLLRLLPVLDHFEMALAAMDQSQGATLESMRTGVQMIAGQLRAALAEAGLEEIETVGKPFDPNWHEAVMQQETPDAPEGQVVQQVRRGYRLRERLLRAASVVVARKPAG
jgi:molecular chaperone GrpE